MDNDKNYSTEQQSDKQWIKKFHEGKLFDAYKYFGCLFDSNNNSAIFRVFAPRATSIFVIGTFNDWKENVTPMKKISKEGIWEAKVENISTNDCYKYLIINGDRKIFKSDPFARYSETLTETNSKIFDSDKMTWCDSAYIKKRDKLNIYRSPINIYEIHIGSWRKNADGSYYNYRQFAEEILDYLRETAYTHIELMGIAEYPYDKSWGYQVTGYYAPTSRYGSPKDFGYLVNTLHRHGIGVIIDWVPGHFPKNENGLYEFDGEPLYEPCDPHRIEHKAWGTRCFDYSKPEVCSFLISNAMMWFDEYHIDGLRVDAVASILYLDYGRNKGEWTPNIYGGNGNLEAVDFFRQLNTVVFSKYSNALMIAEESTSWANVTKPTYLDGLGFNFKWNMGWMNDTLSYISTHPSQRKHIHHKMSFSMTYAFSENFVLPISHDEVVYGKRSLINKMPGTYEEKFANYRLYLMWMYAHPGKKLLFMGNELATFDEWNFAKALYWEVLSYPRHKEAFSFFRTLTRIYRKIKCFWQIEDSWDGFEWLIVDDSENSLFAFQRIDKQGGKIVCIFNFSDKNLDGYEISLEKGSYIKLLTSNIDGFSCGDKRLRTTNKQKGNTGTLTLDIKALSGMYLYKKTSKQTLDKDDLYP